MTPVQWAGLQVIGSLVLLLVTPLCVYKYLTPNECHEDTDLIIGIILVSSVIVLTLFFT